MLQRALSLFVLFTSWRFSFSCIFFSQIRWYLWPVKSKTNLPCKFEKLRRKLIHRIKESWLYRNQTWQPLVSAVFIDWIPYNSFPKCFTSIHFKLLFRCKFRLNFVYWLAVSSSGKTSTQTITIFNSKNVVEMSLDAEIDIIFPKQTVRHQETTA